MIVKKIAPKCKTINKNTKTKLFFVDIKLLFIHQISKKF
ncbi:hypothetical protein MNB_ARC-1_794 [hydrothermal vent metagenome]|uniref:Uncharacterized protein n=1 Tax=hydrothermal vent metagenome TaxID=652676 RepID=A0A3B1EAB0_9ZZZZ